MNLKQKRVIWVGTALIALMGLFPPYYMVVQPPSGGNVRYEKSAGYGFFFAPPDIWNVKIDLILPLRHIQKKSG